MELFTMFKTVLTWFGNHILTIQIFGISLMSWFIAIIVVGLIVAAFSSMSPSLVHLSVDRERLGKVTEKTKNYISEKRNKDKE